MAPDSALTDGTAVETVSSNLRPDSCERAACLINREFTSLSIMRLALQCSIDQIESLKCPDALTMNRGSGVRVSPGHAMAARGHVGKQRP